MGLSASPHSNTLCQETMRKKASRPLDGSPFVFFGVTLSAQSDFLSSYGLHETATTLDIPSCWDPRANQSPTGALVAVLCTAALSRVVVPSVCFTP